MSDAIETFARTAGWVTALVFGSGMLWRFADRHRKDGKREQQLDTLIESVKELTASQKAFVAKTDERLGVHSERLTRVEAQVQAIYPGHFRFPRLADE